MTKNIKKQKIQLPEILLIKDWQRPKSLKSNFGDTAYEPIFTAVGRALSKWEELEEALSRLFMMFTQIQNFGDMKAMGKVFGSQESSASRRKMIGIAAYEYFAHWQFDDKKSKKILETILEVVSKASQRRDEIAHGIARRWTVSADSKTTDYGIFLQAAEYNTERNKETSYIHILLKSNYLYKASDIEEYALKFEALRQEIYKFMSQIKYPAGRLPKPSEIISEPPENSKSDAPE